MLKSWRTMDVPNPSSAPVGAAAASVILGISAEVCAALVLSASSSRQPIKTLFVIANTSIRHPEAKNTAPFTHLSSSEALSVSESSAESAVASAESDVASAESEVDSVASADVVDDGIESVAVVSNRSRAATDVELLLTNSVTAGLALGGKSGLGGLGITLANLEDGRPNVLRRGAADVLEIPWFELGAART